MASTPQSNGASKKTTSTSKPKVMDMHDCLVDALRALAAQSDQDHSGANGKYAEIVKQLKKSDGT